MARCPCGPPEQFWYIFLTMSAPSRHTRRQPTRGRPSGEVPNVLWPIRGPVTIRQRMKIACAEEGLTYAGLIEKFLDERDEKIRRQRAAQRSPLHRPKAEI
ncbi:ribbon-helix-helix DNA binding domain protein [Mycobacterium phage Kloppinator]|nr:ribbon-helix-helix DNA binding domain protein [Mycobacterium phage Kloppinator]